MYRTALAALAGVTLAACPAVAAPTASNPHHLPPYWHQNAPQWCDEDMVCWIGTRDDSRSDAASLRDWRKQMHTAYADTTVVYVYLSGRDTDGQPLAVEAHTLHHFRACREESDGYVTCRADLDGYSRPVWVREQ